MQEGEEGLVCRALTAMTKIAARYPDLRPRVRLLLEKAVSGYDGMAGNDVALRAAACLRMLADGPRLQALTWHAGTSVLQGLATGQPVPARPLAASLMV